MKVLIEKGLYLNWYHCIVLLWLTFQSGSTALMYAAAADFPYTCNELLIRGADLTLTNDYDQDAYTLTTTNNCKLGKFFDKCVIFGLSYLILFYFLLTILIFYSSNCDRKLFDWLPQQDVKYFTHSCSVASDNQHNGFICIQQLKWKYRDLVYNIKCI